MLISPRDIQVRLDSADPAARWNLPTDMAAPTKVLFCDDRTHQATLACDDEPPRHWSSPLAALDWMAQSIRADPKSARWVGYLSYDLGRLFEPMPHHARGGLALPLFVFTYHRHGIENPPPPSAALSSQPRPQSNFTRPQYLAAVERILEYIRAGDVFQVNFAQRFTAQLLDSPAAVYHRLRSATPAAYGALLDYGDLALLSNSPELFLRVSSDGRVLTRPIKGTRPAAPGMEQTLRDSLKDQAELNMIVDLERNDLGRVCRIGSVRVSQPRVIEAHPTLFHAAAAIEGELNPQTTFVDLLRAVFPGGSVTGAPKIRAMQIIDELEPVRRGPYCGAIGYLDAGGAMEFNVAIRTMICRKKLAYISVGGGIVADSDPAQEYDETLLKAQAMFAALGVR